MNIRIRAPGIVESACESVKQTSPSQSGIYGSFKILQSRVTDVTELSQNLLHYAYVKSF